MSRQRMMVISRRGAGAHAAAHSCRPNHRRRELAVANRPVLELETKLVRGRPGLRDQLRIVDLGQIDDAPIVAEVLVAELGPTIETKALPHQSIEMLGEEVGEVERSRLGFVQDGRTDRAGEELIAMSTGQSIDPSTGEHGVEGAAGAAVGVADEHLLVSARRRVQLALDRRGDLVGGVVELGGKAFDVDPCQAVRP